MSGDLGSFQRGSLHRTLDITRLQVLRNEVSLITIATPRGVDDVGNLNRRALISATLMISDAAMFAERQHEQRIA